MTYTTKQLSELTGLSRAEIHKLRHGFKQSNPFTGKIYRYAPLLVQDKHWSWQGGVIKYKPIAVSIIMNKKNKVTK